MSKKDKKLKAIRNRYWYRTWSELIKIYDKGDPTTLFERFFGLLDEKRVFIYHRSMLWALESLHQALKDHDKDNDVERISKSIITCGYVYSKEAKKMRDKLNALRESEGRRLHGNDIPF